MRKRRGRPFSSSLSSSKDSSGSIEPKAKKNERRRGTESTDYRSKPRTSAVVNRPREVHTVRRHRSRKRRVDESSIDRDHGSRRYYYPSTRDSPPRKSRHTSRHPDDPRHVRDCDDRVNDPYRRNERPQSVHEEYREVHLNEYHSYNRYEDVTIPLKRNQSGPMTQASHNSPNRSGIYINYPQIHSPNQNSFSQIQYGRNEWCREEKQQFGGRRTSWSSLNINPIETLQNLNVNEMGLLNSHNRVNRQISYLSRRSGKPLNQQPLLSHHHPQSTTEIVATIEKPLSRDEIEQQLLKYEQKPLIDLTEVKLLNDKIKREFVPRDLDCIIGFHRSNVDAYIVQFVLGLIKRYQRPFTSLQEIQTKFDDLFGKSTNREIGSSNGALIKATIDVVFRDVKKKTQYYDHFTEVPLGEFSVVRNLRHLEEALLMRLYRVVKSNLVVKSNPQSWRNDLLNFTTCGKLGDILDEIETNLKKTPYSDSTVKPIIRNKVLEDFFKWQLHPYLLKNPLATKDTLHTLNRPSSPLSNSRIFECEQEQAFTIKLSGYRDEVEKEKREAKPQNDPLPSDWGSTNKTSATLNVKTQSSPHDQPSCMTTSFSLPASLTKDWTPTVQTPTSTLLSFTPATTPRNGEVRHEYFVRVDRPYPPRSISQEEAKLQKLIFCKKGDVLICSEQNNQQRLLCRKDTDPFHTGYIDVDYVTILDLLDEDDLNQLNKADTPRHQICCSNASVVMKEEPQKEKEDYQQQYEILTSQTSVSIKSPLDINQSVTLSPGERDPDKTDDDEIEPSSIIVIDEPRSWFDPPSCHDILDNSFPNSYDIDYYYPPAKNEHDKLSNVNRDDGINLQRPIATDKNSIVQNDDLLMISVEPSSMVGMIEIREEESKNTEEHLNHQTNEAGCGSSIDITEKPDIRFVTDVPRIEGPSLGTSNKEESVQVWDVPMSRDSREKDRNAVNRVFVDGETNRIITVSDYFCNLVHACVSSPHLLVDEFYWSRRGLSLGTMIRLKEVASKLQERPNSRDGCRPDFPDKGMIAKLVRLAFIDSLKLLQQPLGCYYLEYLECSLDLLVSTNYPLLFAVLSTDHARKLVQAFKLRVAEETVLTSSVDLFYDE